MYNMRPRKHLGTDFESLIELTQTQNMSMLLVSNKLPIRMTKLEKRSQMIMLNLTFLHENYSEKNFQQYLGFDSIERYVPNESESFLLGLGSS